ncbi:2-oxoadipate dioxygenase/decarboxylase family protein, partial [Promicromonospora kroppenstedtii]|uniref:2-oxoadipate dioxygenase/decarboxylase family protein n=1 Tax=Promicromonospora kroppenstedtii TaxID=440482 RepID=UPI0005644D3D
AAAARADDPGFTEAQRQQLARAVWQRTFPTTEAALADQELGWFTYEVDPAGAGVVRQPIVYEDFLPRSAAGIFQSNLTSDGAKDASQEGTDRDADWMAGALGRDLNDPFDLYADQVARSLASAAETLGVDPATLTTTHRTTGATR